MPSSKSESMEMTQSEHTKERLAGIKLPKINTVCSTENNFPLFPFTLICTWTLSVYHLMWYLIHQEKIKAITLITGNIIKYFDEYMNLYRLHVEIVLNHQDLLWIFAETSELDLPIKPDKKWVHMDKVEYDKLSWLKDLPQPTTDHSEVGYHVYIQTVKILLTSYIHTCMR